MKRKYIWSVIIIVVIIALVYVLQVFLSSPFNGYVKTSLDPQYLPTAEFLIDLTDWKLVHLLVVQLVAPNQQYMRVLNLVSNKGFMGRKTKLLLTLYFSSIISKSVSKM